MINSLKYTYMLPILFLSSCSFLYRNVNGIKPMKAESLVAVRKEFKKRCKCNATTYITKNNLYALLSYFSNGDSAKISFRLPLAAVLNAKNEFLVNHKPGKTDCYSNFEDALKNERSFDARPLDSNVRLYAVLDRVNATVRIDSNVQYVVLVFWTMATNHANKTQLRAWMKYANQSKYLLIIPVNVDPIK